MLWVLKRRYNLTKECDFKLSDSEEPDKMLQNVKFSSGFAQCFNCRKKTTFNGTKYI